jgi:hypothetical protein
MIMIERKPPDDNSPVLGVIDYRARGDDRRRLRELFLICRITGVVGLITAGACGWQIWELAAPAFYGAPTIPWLPLAVLGTVFLLISCIALLCVGSRATVIGVLVATVPLWIFYRPATVATVSAIMGKQSEFDVMAFVPPELLLCTTALAIAAVRRTGRPAM